MRKIALLFLILLILANDSLFVVSTQIVTAQSQEILTNKDVIQMVKAGISVEIITAKIKTSKTEFDTTTIALQELKKEGVPDSIILVMLQPNPIENKPTRLKDELTTSFNRLQTSIVTVWSEFGHGTGFIIDNEGLILTNQHVVGPSQFISVQFDVNKKIPAVLLAASPEKDIAVLWVNLEAIPDATVTMIAKASDSEPVLVEGERVFTIGSPLNQRKIITTGIASKVEERAILSDININPGNSGGPLFNSIGEVVGITTFGDVSGRGGPGVSGIVRIEQASPLIEEAKKKMSAVPKPQARLLPVDPIDTFPLDAIKDIAIAKKFDTDRYFFSIGDFNITLLTPTLKYRIETEAEREAAKTRESRNKKQGAVQGTFQPFEDFYAWREYVGDYKPILIIRATPMLGETFGSMFGRALLGGMAGVRAPARLRFKTDFYRMKLMCGDKEIEPIHPAKIAHILNESNVFVTVKDATYEGLYSYPANAISPSCGKVTLEMYSEKEPSKAKTKVLNEKTVLRMADDFAPYLNSRKN